jgi:hypothetical protein
LKHALADSTLSAQRTAIRAFRERFANAHSMSPTRLAKHITANDLQAFVVFLARTNTRHKLQHSSISSYISHIKRDAIDRNVDISAFDDKRIIHLIQGVRRRYGVPTRKRHPFAPGMFPSFCHRLCLYDSNNLRIVTFVGLSLALMTRAGELCRTSSSSVPVRRRDVATTAKHINIFIRRSKTDKGNRGATLRLPLPTADDDEYHPVHLVRRMMCRAPNKHENAPLFQDNGGRHWSYTSALASFRDGIVRAKLGMPSEFGLHSLRAGGPTHLARDNNTNRNTIQTLGRWRSDAVDTYIRPDGDTLDDGIINIINASRTQQQSRGFLLSPAAPG